MAESMSANVCSVGFPTLECCYSSKNGWCAEEQGGRFEAWQLM